MSLITQTGELWSVEQTASGPKLTKGTVTTTGNAFTGTLTTYDGLLSASGTVNGAFVENKSLNGTSNISGATGTFAMTYQANYATAPTLIARGGTYKMTGGTVVLATNGSIAGSRGGCSFTGQLTPDASGKNFYRLSLTFGASPCVLPAASATGVAVVDDVSVVAGYVSGGAGEAIYATK